MDDEQLREHYKDWIKDYCNDDFLDDEGNENLPAGVELALEKLIEYEQNVETGVESKSRGGKSASYINRSRIPDNIKEMLAPYRKVSW